MLWFSWLAAQTSLLYVAYKIVKFCNFQFNVEIVNWKKKISNQHHFFTSIFIDSLNLRNKMPVFVLF